MFRLTLGKVKTGIANVLNWNTSDSRLVDVINEAQERLLHSGRWVQSTARYEVCVSDGCITWPRAIESIEAYALCDTPGPIRNGWYEFLGGGPGILDSEDCAGNQLIDRGEAASYADPSGTGKKLAISCDQTETTTEKVILRYYNSSSNWVRTQDGDGNWIDGEEITLPAAGAYAYSTYEVVASGFAGIIKPVTNNIIRLWEYDTSALTYRALGVYEPSEDLPVYRRSLIPGLSLSDGDTRTVTIRAKLRHINVSEDNDYLIIGSQPALRLACQAIRKEQQDLADSALKYWQLAFGVLDSQLQHHNGGAGVMIKVDESFIGMNMPEVI